MSLEEYHHEFMRAFIDAGHKPVLDDDGTPDTFAVSGGYHNGPKCQTCGWGQCVWCAEPKDIPKCSSILAENAARDKAQRQQLADILGYTEVKD